LSGALNKKRNRKKWNCKHLQTQALRQEQMEEELEPRIP